MDSRAIRPAAWLLPLLQLCASNLRRIRTKLGRISLELRLRLREILAPRRRGINFRSIGFMRLFGRLSQEQFYSEAGSLLHGFLRARDGISVPSTRQARPRPFHKSINPAGAVTGYYYDATGLAHDILWACDGTLTIFDPPGTDLNGIFGAFINPAGTITGYYLKGGLGLRGTCALARAHSPPSIRRARRRPTPQASIARCWHRRNSRSKARGCLPSRC